MRMDNYCDLSCPKLKTGMAYNKEGKKVNGVHFCAGKRLQDKQGMPIRREDCSYNNIDKS